MYLLVMQRISTKSRIYLNNKKIVPPYFYLLMLELKCDVHRVLFEKDPEKGYHWSDPSRQLHAYSRQAVA